MKLETIFFIRNLNSNKQNIGATLLLSQQQRQPNLLFTQVKGD